ncbi:interleukin-20 receptor subunit alpha isoform X2 [Psammomys obesus]|uniref:interleukin-20 receptor subunit alpha isoform X2 n=1 Tax=Psammomys obesus TaxID=48139 RepID=UPI002452D441|nr:interleukin-20 receptor subunit alpha isoform X2 [Psammomys obesus]
MRAPGTPAPRRPALPPLPPPLLLLLLLAASGQAVPCVFGGVPKPTNIGFLSVNMKNVLHWNPPEALRGFEVTYAVQYFIYGQKKWLNVAECRNVSRTYCDLSAETADYEHQYYAKVKAIWETKCSEWAETGRFYPFLETQVGPPKVALTTGEKSISIVLTAPDRWKRKPNDDTVSMQQIYPSLKYCVSVYDAKSRRMWSQCLSDSTLVLRWLEPSTLYCVHVESFVPGPPRLSLPSQKQCISTLEAQTSSLTVRVIFWYILPTSLAVFLFSVIGYSVYRYIYVGKEKHPSNLILIYGNEIDKKVFEPAETVSLDFITLGMLDDSTVSQKDLSLLEKSSDDSSVNDPKLSGSWETHLEGRHLGNSSDLTVIVCGAEQSNRDTSPAQYEWLSCTTPTGEAETEPEYKQLCGQEEAARAGELSEPQTALAKLEPQPDDLPDLGQEHPGSEDGPEEEPSSTLVDWDPQTGRLCIPAFPSFDQDPEGYGRCDRDHLSEDGLLSRLYGNHMPDQADEESESSLMQFTEEWGLYVQMES